MSIILKSRCYAVAILLLAAALGSAGRAAELPAYMQPIAGAVTTSPAEVANDNVLALNTSMFQLYGDASKIFQPEHPCPASRHPGPLLGCRRAVHPLSSRRGAARGTAGPDRLSTLEVGRPQRHGADRGDQPLYRQSGEPGMARVAARGLSQPDAIGAGYAGRRRPAGGLRFPSLARSSRTMSLSWTPAPRRARSRWPT